MRIDLRRLAPLVLAAALVLAATLGRSVAQGGGAEPPPLAFAALEIVPAGDQRFDITTGRTELPDGGRVIDASTGIRLDAEVISFVEGERIDATGVEVFGSFGRLSAESVTIDIAGSQLTAGGGLLLERDALTLQAAEVRYDAIAEIASFVGPVVGSSPDFEADGLLLDTVTGTALLLGPYRFRNGPLTLTSTRSEGRLELIVEGSEGGSSYRVASEVDPATLARFADHMP